MEWAKTIASRDEKHLSFEIWCGVYRRFDGIDSQTLILMFQCFGCYNIWIMYPDDYFWRENYMNPTKCIWWCSAFIRQAPYIACPINMNTSIVVVLYWSTLLTSFLLTSRHWGYHAVPLVSLKYGNSAGWEAAALLICLCCRCFPTPVTYEPGIA